QPPRRKGVGGEPRVNKRDGARQVGIAQIPVERLQLVRPQHPLVDDGFARISRSTPPNSRSNPVRTISLKRRLTRFLSTIFCLCLGTTTPTRGYDNREADARASRRSVCIRFPVRLTASRSASLVSLDLRGKPKALGAGVFRRQLNG